MNIYKTKFFATCPANGQVIEYDLAIYSGVMLRVESILAELDTLKTGFHEDIADRLLEIFGGSQRLVAHHHGVSIETLRTVRG